MDEKYFPEQIEQKWQQHWNEASILKLRPDDPREEILLPRDAALPI